MVPPAVGVLESVPGIAIVSLVDAVSGLLLESLPHALAMREAESDNPKMPMMRRFIVAPSCEYLLVGNPIPK
jgi:hypothetical protein